MNKDELNGALRQYAQKKLSPTSHERQLVTKIYAAIQTVLGSNNCIQIGSYPRFTATTPLDDLDVLYRIGVWPGFTPDPSSNLRELKEKIEKDFENPTNYRIKVELQTHSITISFIENSENNFSVDIVPAYIVGVNEFLQETYMVPELVMRRPRTRRSFYEDLTRRGRTMSWIKSDPRGYIEIAKRVNDANSDFRKSAKVVKAWKWFCKECNDDFKLKSFHIEQVITGYFRSIPHLEIHDAIVLFFQSLAAIISRPQIPDRADNAKYIDDYVKDLTPDQRQVIIVAGNLTLQKLEQITSPSDIEDVINDDVKQMKRAQNITSQVTNTNTYDESFIPAAPWGIK